MIGSAGPSGKGVLTPLVDALHTLGLAGEVTLAGRWATVQGGRCTVFVVQTSGGGFYVWCGDPCDRTVEFHRNAIRAIEAGLRRSAQEGTEDIDRNNDH